MGGPSGTLGVTRGACGQLPWQEPGSTANFATGGVFHRFSTGVILDRIGQRTPKVHRLWPAWVVSM